MEIVESYRLTVQDVVRDDRLRCPSCQGNLRVETADASARTGTLGCVRCRDIYSVVDGIPLMAQGSHTTPKKEEIQAFWAELYSAAYGDFHASLTAETLRRLLVDLEKMFVYRRHLAAVEMPLESLRDLQILEVGSGAGAHSALFASRGACVTSLDLTPARALATARKLDLLQAHGAFAVQGDAERLPFPDAYFDIVYANGVLHHTPDTEQSIREVRRVLKPGGKAIVMLYAKHSFYYLVTLYLVHGWLLGKRRRAGWVGRSTEWMSSKAQTVSNPITKVYSKSDIRELFSLFHDVRIRQSGFGFSQISRVGTQLERLARRRSQVSEAGKLVYDAPWSYETGFELWLGQWAGFDLNISAVK